MELVQFSHSQIEQASARSAEGFQLRNPMGSRRDTLARCVSGALRLGIGLLGLALIPPRANAEVITAEDYSITMWQSEDGLPDDTVCSMAQTPDGFLWVGTSSGLTRFDGVHFTAVREANELGRERIARLFVDHSGRLWICTESGRLASYVEGQFKLLQSDSGWPKQRVTSFADDRDASLVLTTETGGVFRIQNGHCLAIRAEGIATAVAAQLAVDCWGDQSVWIRTDKAVGVVRGQTWRQIPRVNGPKPERLGPLTPRRAGGIWMFASERRLELLQGDRWPIETRRYPDFMDPSVLLEDSSGNLWFGTGQQGLARLASDGTVSRFYQGTGFPTDTINCLLEDCDGNIWVGGNGGGLIRLTRRKFSTFKALGAMRETASLCFSEDAQGALWIAFGEKGLYRLERGKLSGPVTLAGRGMQGSIWSMLAGTQNRMWFGAYGSGVFLAQGKKSEVWTVKDGLPSTDLRCLFEDPEQAIWIGTVRGLCRFDGASFCDVTERNEFPQGAVQAITRDQSGSLWVGTLAGQLIQWRDGKATVFCSTNGLPGQTIQELVADADGSLWIGTMGGGLCWRRGGRFFQFNGRTGLPVDDIVGIVDDGLGYLWLASNRGVVRVSRADLSAVADGKQARLNVRSFDRTDGLPSNRVSTGHPCAARLADGRLCFATLGGIAVVEPRGLRVNESRPEVVIEDMLVDGQSQLATKTEGRVRVSHGARRIEFRYTAPNLSAPERLHFEYRIAGLDDQWQDAGTERTVSYRGFQPGEYRFEVAATVGPGTERAKSASWPFVVEPLFWESTWFRSGAFVSLALVVGVVFRVRMGVLERKRAVQEEFSRQLIEQQETERKRIATELHDSLGQSLAIIKNHAVLAENPRESASHVAGISQEASEALASVRDICHALRPVELERLGLSKTLRSIAERIAASSGLQIVAEIDPVDALIATDNWIHVLRLVQEAFNNIIKHAQATRVNVTLREDEHCLRLVITDDGCGFDPATAVPGRTMGLSTMEERARIMGAKLKLESAKGRGTTLRLDLPVSPPRQSGAGAA